MVVTVVDEAGKPIPNANGYYRFGNYVNFDVDENGVFVADIASEEERKKRTTTDFTIRAEGFGPFQAMFGSDPVIPDTFRVVLKPAQRIGSVVVDEEGQPVEGVKVSLSIRFETAYKTADLFVTTVETKTDAAGKWSLFHLPATFSGSPSLGLEKEGYLPTPIADVPASRLNPDADGNFSEKLVIERGYTFSGTVVDEADTPVEGANVALGFWHTEREPVKTDKDGKFCIENLPLQDRELLVAAAPGRALTVQAVEIRSTEEPAKIVLQPGRTVEFTVMDSTSKPVSEAEIRIHGIDGLPGANFQMLSPLIPKMKTGGEGKFVWKEAPQTPFEAYCFKKEYLGVSLPCDARQNVAETVLYRAKVVLRVVDDVTGEPVPAFTVITRNYENVDDERFRSWTMPEPGNNGLQEGYLNDGGEKKAWRFDVQAPGYANASSRKIRYGEEDVEVIVRMPKSAAETSTTADSPIQKPERLFPPSGGKILTPDGDAAKNASIEVAVADHLLCGTNASPVFSDEKGEFLLSDDQIAMIGPQNFVLKITHSAGVAVLDGEEFRQSYDNQQSEDAKSVRLIKWGRIEGTLQAGEKKLEGTEMMARWTKPENWAAAPIFYWGTRTKKDGRFVMEQVMPGTVTLHRMISDGGVLASWLTYCESVEVKPGETTFCTVGGKGRAAVGRAVLPQNDAEIDFRDYTARIVIMPENVDDLISPVLPKEYWPEQNPTPEQQETCNVKLLAWYQTPEGKQYKEQRERHLQATANLRFAVLDAEGRFRFGDLPCGNYALVISATDNCGMDFAIGDWYLRDSFAIDSPSESEPFDLGERKLVENRDNGL